MFKNRVEAGRLLANALRHLADEDVVVLGLPRGGVPVALEVARMLAVPLDVIVVRKLGVPGQPELAMGAIGEGDVAFIDWDVVSAAGVTGLQLSRAIRRERDVLERRARLFRGEGELMDLSGRVVVIVDDGIATGSSMNAAVRVARTLGAVRVIVAAPVAPAEAMEALLAVSDAVVVLETPEPFYAIGQFYDDFAQTPYSEVIAALQGGLPSIRPRQLSMAGTGIDL
jgi:putative phosphoribosyl transferase